jgi:ectoine hydroxylase-related dioxygenase (phytanoyl-CoA dioxygenase family)
MPDELDDALALPPGAAERYRDDGFVHLRDVLAPATLERYRVAISASVAAFNTLDLPMEERDTYQKAFLQVMNLWTRDPAVRRFVFGRRLARIAAQLMGVAGVRLYHDQALYKEPGGGHTPWHADQYYWPLASDRCCTAWVPLQDTPLPMGPLAFAAGSHRLELGRDLAISDESEREIAQALERAGLPMVEEPFALGDVSFHAGWTFHRAGENRTPRMREVMTVIYMDAQMRLAAPRNPNQQADRDTWCPGALVGERIETRLNPVLFR